MLILVIFMAGSTLRVWRRRLVGEPCTGASHARACLGDEGLVRALSKSRGDRLQTKKRQNKAVHVCDA